MTSRDFWRRVGGLRGCLEHSDDAGGGVRAAWARGIEMCERSQMIDPSSKRVVEYTDPDISNWVTTRRWIICPSYCPVVK